jgi:hypothetical protein
MLCGTQETNKWRFKMAINVGTYVPSRGKHKKVSKDGEPDIGDPDKYELFLRRRDIVEALLTLEVGNKKMRSAVLMGVTSDELLYTGTYLGGAEHGLNKVFASGLPFYARARGGRIYIGRISHKFDPNNYAINGHHKPHNGERQRIEKWLKELSDVGIVFEMQGQWKPFTTDEAHKMVQVIPEMDEVTKELFGAAKIEYLEYLRELDRKDAEKAALDDALDAVEQVEIPKHSITTAMRDGSKDEKKENSENSDVEENPETEEDITEQEVQNEELLQGTG